jgi:ribosomal 50S subunit-recycling heat shock protein
MRIDLLLKSLCLVKTRNQGRKGCESGYVRLNGKAVKPSREIRAGDVIEIRYPRRLLVVELIEVPPGRIARRDRERFIRVIRETPLHPGDEVLDD